MCQTATIQKDIVRLGTRSYRSRMEAAGGEIMSARKLAQLNRSIDKLYDLIYDGVENITMKQYQEFAPQLQILISTVKDLYSFCRKSASASILSDEISRLGRNYSAMYELDADLRRLSGKSNDNIEFKDLSKKVTSALGNL